MKTCAATLLRRPQQQSQNKGLHFEVELWWNRTLKVLLLLRVHHFFLFLSFFAGCLFCQQDKALLWVAACSTATSVLLECQSWQSVGGICGRYRSLGDRCRVLPRRWLKHSPQKACVGKLDRFLVGFKPIFIRANKVGSLYHGRFPFFFPPWHRAV